MFEWNRWIGRGFTYIFNLGDHTRIYQLVKEEFFANQDLTNFEPVDCHSRLGLLICVPVVHHFAKTLQFLR